VKGLRKQSDFADRDEIGEIIKRDDRDAIAKLVESGALEIEAEDSHGRTPVERATIAASPKIIDYLLEKGARLRASLELAKTNAKYLRSIAQSFLFLNFFKRR
jgi:ankyrin repeat protein